MSISQKQLRDILSYDPESGEFHWVRPSCQRIKPGMRAGYTHCGYRKITIGHDEYREHWLVWLYVYGYIPSQIIDHIDHDGTNNRLANLRLASVSQNNAHRKAQRNNTSGFKGASYYRPNGKWRAAIKHAGLIRHLGYYDTPEEAHAAYMRAATELHGEFATG